MTALTAEASKTDHSNTVGSIATMSLTASPLKQGKLPSGQTVEKIDPKKEGTAPKSDSKCCCTWKVVVAVALIILGAALLVTGIGALAGSASITASLAAIGLLPGSAGFVAFGVGFVAGGAGCGIGAFFLLRKDAEPAKRDPQSDKSGNSSVPPSETVPSAPEMTLLQRVQEGVRKHVAGELQRTKTEEPKKAAEQVVNIQMELTNAIKKRAAEGIQSPRGKPTPISLPTQGDLSKASAPVNTTSAILSPRSPDEVVLPFQVVVRQTATGSAGSAVVEKRVSEANASESAEKGQTPAQSLSVAKSEQQTGTVTAVSGQAAQQS
jgi:hypothetical protein